MSSSQSVLTRIEEVVAHGFCVGCGACAVAVPGLTMQETEIGTYVPKITEDLDCSPGSEVCPFSDVSHDETQLAQDLFPDSANADELVGRFNAVFAGHVLEDDYREVGSSGGLVSWLAAELLRLGHIDCVIHAKATFDKGTLFEYGLSDTIQAVRQGAKTKYYPVHLDEALKELAESDKRALIIGVPCFIKAVRNLCRRNAKLKQNILFTLSLVCGHLKSKSFTDYLALNAGLNPQDVVHMDFRAAMPDRDAHSYGIKVTTERLDGQRLEAVAGPVKSFFGEDWGIGLFKLGGCEFCDDVAGETADITIGDAWIPPYESDYRGTNIVVCRNTLLELVLRNAVEDKRLLLDTLQGEDFVYSQAGSYRHRREGLAFRADWYAQQGKKFPKKRVKGLQRPLPKKEVQILKRRHSLSRMSHDVFRRFGAGKAIWQFNLAMFYPIKAYHATQTSWLQALVPDRLKRGLKNLLRRSAVGHRANKTLRRAYIQNHTMR